MPHNKIKQISIGLVKRNAARRGPTSSDQWNDSWDEVVNDLKRFATQWNEGLVTLVSLLPDGTNDLDSFDDGLDGRTLFVDASAVADVTDTTYFNTVKTRPNSVKEQFGNVYNRFITEGNAFQAKLDALRADVLVDSTEFIKEDGSVPMTGTFKAIGGNAANPGLTFADDTDTGIFKPLSDVLAMSVGGVERLRLGVSNNTLAGGLDITSGNIDISLGVLELAGTTRINATGDATLNSVVTAAFRLTAAPTAGFILQSDASGNGTWVVSSAGGVTDHGALTGLGDDDHSIYLLLAGRSGGQTVKGGNNVNENLILQSTSAGNKGLIFFGSGSAFDEDNERLGIGHTAPSRNLEVVGNFAVKTTASGVQLLVDIDGSAVNLRSIDEFGSADLPLRVYTSGILRAEFNNDGLLIASSNDLNIDTGDLLLAGTTRINNTGDAFFDDTTVSTLTTAGLTLTAGAVDGYHLVSDGAGVASWTANIPVSGIQEIDTSTDNGIARWDGTAGNTLQDSVVTITDAGRLQATTGVQVSFSGVAGNYSIEETDYIVAVDTSGGAYLMILPDSTSVGPGSIYLVKDSSGDAGSNNITVSGLSAQTLDGSDADVISTNYGVGVYTSDGTNWLIV